MANHFTETDPSPAIKMAVNYVAAVLGIGTFLGLVNLIVGIFSVTWLGVQMYGYFTHEIPIKRLRKKLLQREYDSAIAKLKENINEQK